MADKGAAVPITLRFVLPLPPGVNNQYATVGRKRVLSSGARSFHRDVKKVVAAMRQRGTITSVMDHAFASSLLGAYMTYYFETPYRRDLDGGLKITLDALGRELGFDDRAVVDLHLSKRIDPLRPRVEIDLETINGWEFDRTYRYLGESERPLAPANEERDHPNDAGV